MPYTRADAIRFTDSAEASYARLARRKAESAAPSQPPPSPASPERGVPGKAPQLDQDHQSQPKAAAGPSVDQTASWSVLEAIAALQALGLPGAVAKVKVESAAGRMAASASVAELIREAL